jgi:hypothetical protein
MLLCLKVENVCWNVTKLSWNFLQLFIIRNAICANIPFQFGREQVCWTFASKKKKSLQKNTAKLTEAAEEQVFLLTYHQGFHQSLSSVDCTIESRICDKQMKEKCTTEWALPLVLGKVPGDPISPFWAGKQAS